VHVMVAWEIKASAEDRAPEISSALRGALSGYSWVRTLGNVYVVKVRSESDRHDLGESLKSVARELGGVNVIYTPAMEGGRYNGWLPKALWARIRQRVDDV
jgi:hypothetical protein